MVDTVNNVSTLQAVVLVERTTAELLWENVQTDILLDYDSKNRQLLDSTAFTDVAWKGFTLNGTISTATPIDALANTLIKTLADSVTMSDNVVTGLGFNNGFTDTITIHDNKLDYATGPVLNTFVMNSGPLLATSVTSPNVTLSTGKGTNDSATLSDLFSYISAVGYSPSDPAVMADVFTPSFTKNISDSLSLSDDFAIHETRNHSLVNSTVMLDAATISVIAGYALNGNVSTLNSTTLN